jgi:hypothetical protein
MATAPYGIRLLVGAATLAAEETKKLPQTILMYPMTLASQAAHIVMRWQQGLAELAIKGDSTLEAWFPPRDEQPQWATFDEDLDETGDVAKPAPGLITGAAPNSQSAGRFALYSTNDVPVLDAPGTGAAAPTGNNAAAAPNIAAELGYEALTLAQLRARLRSLNVTDLQTLLAYEEATKARAPFQTLLANTITRTTAK